MPKQSKFTDEPIAYAVQQADAVRPIADICRTVGGREATSFRWKSQYGALGTAEVPRLR